MSHDATKSGRVVRVAAGVESTSQAVPVRDARHETLAVLIGRWINEGRSIAGDVLRWSGDRTGCTVTMTDGGMTQVAHHESSVDGVTWTASMDVVLRKCG